MIENEVIYYQNPKIDHFFGYFGNLEVPTKQGGFKPVEMIETKENGVEEIINKFYVRKPDTQSVTNFKQYIENLTKTKFNEINRINKPYDVEVLLSISMTEKRYKVVDVDNLAKAVLDSLKTIAFEDDSQISSLIVQKHIHPMMTNGILIGITKLTKENRGFGGDIRTFSTQKWK